LINEDRLIARFLNMIKIDSPSRMEEEFCKYLQKEFSALGYHSVIDQAGIKFNSLGGNLLVHVKGNNQNIPPMLFSAHMDTVVSNKNLKTIIEKGTIRTDGKTILGGDDKAGIAILLEAITIIKERKLAHGDLELVFTIGEEIGLYGSRYLDYSLLKSKFGYVLDSGGDVGTVINNAPGQEDFKIQIIGKEAHSGVNPEDGINAIQMAGDFLTWFPYGKIDEETTGNIGTISGGEAVNIVPGKVDLVGEFRSRNEQKLSNWVKQIKPRLIEIKNKFGGEFRLETEKVYSPYHCREEELVIRLVLRALNRQGIEGQLKARGGGSDANNYNSNGINTVNLGIGLTKGHTNEEEITTANLVKGTQLVIDLIQEAESAKGI